MRISGTAQDGVMVQDSSRRNVPARLESQSPASIYGFSHGEAGTQAPTPRFGASCVDFRCDPVDHAPDARALWGQDWALDALIRCGLAFSSDRPRTRRTATQPSLSMVRSLLHRKNIIQTASVIRLPEPQARAPDAVEDHRPFPSSEV